MAGKQVPATEDVKKELILRTAAELFGRKGYYGTRVSEIARDAGVSLKTVYNRFDGKKELFVRTRAWVSDRLRQDLASGLLESATGTAQELFRSLLDGYGVFIRENRGYARILAEAVAVADREIREDYSLQVAESAELLRVLLEQDVLIGETTLAGDPGYSAWAFLAFGSIIAYTLLLGLDAGKDGLDAVYALERFYDALTV